MLTITLIRLQFNRVEKVCELNISYKDKFFPKIKFNWLREKWKQILTKARDFNNKQDRENYRETAPYLEQPGHHCLHFPCEKPPWNSMDFHAKILHGIPWRIRTSISMEFHGNFSIDFHGKYLHEGLGHFPWNSMENIKAPISMEFHGNFCIDIFHGRLGHFLWNSMEKFHAIP